jgi:enoyl-CoA hydratase/carnithine racemase
MADPKKRQEERMYEQILYDVEEPLATIRLNRPDQLNAWTNQMGTEVKHAVAEAEADSRVVAILLTGEGRGFCAGADMRGLQSLTEGGAFTGGGGEALAEASPGQADMEEGFRGAYSYLMSVRKPIIAAINGPCAGMALPIALCCDIRFASDRAVFTTAFVRRGLIAEWGVAWMLPRIVGTAHAMDLILSGRKIDAQEAAAVGLVNRVVPHDELMEFTREYARDLASSCSPTSMQIMKRQVYEGLHESFGESNAKAIRLMGDSMTRGDFKEGVASFMERRPPKFPRV